MYVVCIFSTEIRHGITRHVDIAYHCFVLNICSVSEAKTIYAVCMFHLSILLCLISSSTLRRQCGHVIRISVFAAEL